MVWIPDSELSLKICLAVSTEYRRVMEGRTDIDGQTSYDGKVHTMHSIVW